MNWPVIVLLFLSTIIFARAEDKVQTVPIESRVSCYVCNSDNTGEGNCTSSDPDVLKGYVQVCPKLNEGPLAGKEANSCRKVLQNFGEDNNVVRECAYTGSEPVDGKRRTGNKGITLYIYQCFNEENSKPCNSAISIRLCTIPLALTLMLATLLFLIL